MEVEEKEPSTREIILRYLESKDNEWHKDEEGVYHASGVWKCFRKTIMSEQFEEDLPLGLFEMGHKAEDVLEEGLKHHFNENGGNFVWNSIPVKHEVPTPHGPISIVGSTDPAVIGYNLQPIRLYECKSSESYTTQHGKPPIADETHKHQGGFYAHKLGFPELYIPRPGRSDVLNMPEPDFIIDDPEELERLFHETEEYFAKLHDYRIRGELPPADPFAEKECKYCPFGPKKGNSACPEMGGWYKVKAGNGRVVWRKNEEDLKERDKVLIHPDGSVGASA